MPPNPWKWEIHVDKRLISASHSSYPSQEEAHKAGRDALDKMVTQFADDRKTHDKGD
jgi:hypothetical protein